MKTTLATLLFIISCVQCYAPVINTNKTYAFFEGDVSNITIVGSYFTNITNISIGQYSCAQDTYNVYVSPCLIAHPRVDICDAMKTKTGSPTIQHQLCEQNSNVTCIQGDYAGFPVPACLNFTNNTICTRPRCYTKPLSGGTGCIDYPMTMNGYDCGPTSVCTNGACVNAQDPSCASYVTCNIEGIPQGIYSLTVETLYGITSIDDFIVIAPVPEIYAIDKSIASEGSVVQVSIVPEFYQHAIPWQIASLVVSMHGIQTDATSGSMIMPHLPSPTIITNITANVTYVFGNIYLWRVVPYNGSIEYYPSADVYSACPWQIQAYVNYTISVQGDNFYNSAHLRCIFGGTSVSVSYISKQNVQCTVFSTNETYTISEIYVSNADNVLSLHSTPITIIGACELTKPNSIPVDNTCKCKAGFRDLVYSCIECNDGSFQPDIGQSTCIECAPGEDTMGMIASTDSSACMCKLGKYRPTSDSVCITCPEGLVCDVRGAPSIRQGYWIPQGQSYDSLTPCPSNTHGCTGGNGTGDMLCARGYNGPLCEVCNAGYGKSPTGCQKCPTAGNSKGVVAVVALFTLFLFYILTRISTTTTDESTNTEETFGGVVKIGMNYLQMLFYLGQLQAKWSSHSSNFFSIMTPFSLSVSFYSFECANSIGFYGRMALTMVLPLIFISIFAVLMLLIKLCVPRKHRDHILYINLHTLQTAAVIITYVLDPMIMSQVFSSLRCTSVPHVEGSFVHQDMGISCTSASYFNYKIAASLYIVVFGIGKWALIIYRMHILSPDDVSICLSGSGYTNEADPYAYLMRGYRVETYIWETFILGRKIAVVIVQALLSDAVQLLWVLLILLISLVFTYKNDPFRLRIDNMLETTSLSVLIITLIAAFHEVLLENASSNAVFSIMVIVNVCMWMLFGRIIFKRTRQKVAVMKDMIFESFNGSTQVIEMHSRESIARQNKTQK